MNGLPPPNIIEALGEFDLDPCSPINRPWPTAKKHFTIEDMSLMQNWEGRVWCNPPYGDQTGIWLDKLFQHGNGIALVFARTETQYFQKYVFEVADALFFFKGRLRFYHVTGEQSNQNAGAPSVLIAYGKENAEALKNSGLEGKFVSLNQPVLK